MLRIIKILDTQPFSVTCAFNNGKVGVLDILPILENQKHIQGVSNLFEIENFKRIQIGQFGELVWHKIVAYPPFTELWDYDISPEFAYKNAVFKNEG